MTNQTDQLGSFALCVTHGVDRRLVDQFEAEPGSTVQADTLRILINCDFLECITWRTSNVDHGLIWLDEVGLMKGLDSTAILKDSLKPSFALAGTLVGNLVFTGPTDETGEATWLTEGQVNELQTHLLKTQPTLVNDHSFLELLGIMGKTS